VVSYSRTLNTNWEEMLSIQFGRQGGVTHQLGGEPKMRFVSTALVMMAMALMLLALTLYGPDTVRGGRSER
jgi:hypothetical protein